MKKTIFGIAVATATLSASAFSTSVDEIVGERVGKIATDQWVIINDNEEGVNWDCHEGGTVCKGTLKSGASPDSGGYYSDAEVNQAFENKHFELYEVENN